MLVIRGCCLSFCGCESTGTLAFYNSALQMPQPHRLASPLVRTGRLVSSSEERVLPEQGCRPGQGQAGRRDFLDRLCRPFSRQPRRWTGPRVWERGGLWRRPGAHLSHLSAVGTPGCEASGTLTPPATDGHVWGTETGCRGHAASTATASMPETQARLQLGTGLRSGRASAIPQGSKRAGQHSTVTTLSAPAPGEGFATGRKDTRAEAERCVSPFAFLGLVWCLCWQRQGHGGGGLWDTLSSGCSVAQTTWWEGHRVPRKEDVRPGQRRLVWLRSPPQWTLASIPWAARDRLGSADGWGGHLLGDRARRRPGCPTACKGPLGPSGFESQCSQLPCWLCGSRVRPQTASGRRRLMLVG